MSVRSLLPRIAGSLGRSFMWLIDLHPFVGLAVSAVVFGIVIGLLLAFPWVMFAFGLWSLWDGVFRIKSNPQDGRDND